MCSWTGREHRQEGTASGGAAADHAPAIGKHTQVEAAMAKMAGGAPIPAGVRAGVEAETGGDLSSATVHAGPEAAKLAGDLDARAFTFGLQVVLGAGARAWTTRSCSRTRRRTTYLAVPSHLNAVSPSEIREKFIHDGGSRSNVPLDEPCTSHPRVPRSLGTIRRARIVS